MRSRKIEQLFDVLALLAVPTGLWFAFVFAPMERVMGAIQKIFYFHVSSAWIGFFAFFVTFVMSIIVLARNNRHQWADDIAEASAEVGVVFCTIVLVTGPLWAKPTWGVYWTWDPRLTSTLVLWFMYVAYIMLRGFVDDADKRAKFSAALGIIGFINVPIVFLSIRWWRTIHPNVLQEGGGGLHPDMRTALFVCLGVFTILYVCMMIKRIKLTQLERRVKAIEE